MTSDRAFRLCAALLCASAAAFASAAHAATPAYAMTAVVALGAPDRWDYLFYDQAAKRVYVSHGDEVTVVDGRTGKLVGNVADLPGSHGAAVAPGLGRGIADSAHDRKATIFDSKTLKTIATAPAGEDADGIAYDAATKRAFIADGDAAGLSAVDVETGRAAGALALGGKPEFLVGDGAGRVYVNLESTREIAVVDARKLAVVARYPIPECESPHGIAIDSATHRLFTSCVNAKLVVVDAESGHILATLPIGKGSDAVKFDPKRKLAFSSNGEGTLSVVAEKSADDFELVGNVPTIRGARTMALDSDNGRIFLVSADIDHVDPPQEPGGRPHAVYKPGSVKLYFFDPIR